MVKTPETIQELVGEPPKTYVYKDGLNGFMDSSLPVMDIPVIDVSLLSNSSPSSTSAEELHKLLSALISHGCFLPVNHSMTSSYLDELHCISKEFLALPMEEKHKDSREPNGMEGYGSDKILFNDQILDWSDRLYIILPPNDRQQPKFWPEAFREILQDFATKLGVIVKVILKAMARTLNLDDDCFLHKYGEGAKMEARFNFYPPCRNPDQVLGLKPHSDGSAITIVLLDTEVEGLQFLKENQWCRVPVLPQDLLVNIGDQIEILSNGLFKSPELRAVTNRERERISMAVFCASEPDIDIEPLEDLVTETRPRRYKKVKDYGSFYFKHYQLGKKPIDALII